MDGLQFVKALPESDYVLREMRLLEAIHDGQSMPITWLPIDVSWRERTGTVFVSSDALCLGDENPVRISLSARASQAAADHLGAYLLTTHVADLIAKHATVKIAPQTQGPPKYDYIYQHRTSRMVDHHEAIEKARAGRCGLIDNAGKHWVLTNGYSKHPSKAANYGWFDSHASFVSASGMRVLQPLGFAHNIAHVDYSQTLRLMRASMFVDGKEALIKEVGADPDSYGLVSSEGPLKFWRIPAVLEASEIIDTRPGVPRRQTGRPPTAAGLSAAGRRQRRRRALASLCRHRRGPFLRQPDASAHAGLASGARSGR
jgi:prepilin-type processing-associated H-X9-DG protein